MPPSISVVIPSLAGDVSRSAASLQAQSFTDWELIVVAGVRPAARARNQGIAQAAAPLLLFLDDDAQLGDEGVLERMVQACGPGIGVVGSSKVLPPSATWIQRRAAKEIPRWVYPIVEETVESDPPLDRHGFTAATTTCCLIPRAVIDEVGGFDPDLATGEDTELLYRIRRAGYSIVVAGRAWTWHTPPGTLVGLLRKAFHYGVGHAREAAKDPGRGMAVLNLGHWTGWVIVAGAPLVGLMSIVLPVYLEPRLHVRPGFRPLKAASTLATLYGYVWGHLSRRG